MSDETGHAGVAFFPQLKHGWEGYRYKLRTGYTLLTHGHLLRGDPVSVLTSVTSLLALCRYCRNSHAMTMNAKRSIVCHVARHLRRRAAMHLTVWHCFVVQGLTISFNSFCLILQFEPFYLHCCFKNFALRHTTYFIKNFYVVFIFVLLTKLVKILYFATLSLWLLPAWNAPFSSVCDSPCCSAE
jgi:uncharacterized membrane protein